MIKEPTEKDKLVLDYVKKNPRRTPTEIAHDLGLQNSSYVMNSLSRLSNRFGLVKRMEIICYE